MKDKLSSNIITQSYGTVRRMMPFAVALVLAFTWRATVLADDGGRDNRGGDHDGQGSNGVHGDEGEGNGYQQVNLVADLPNVAMLLDTNLVNAWGLSAGPTTPIWVSDNGTSKSTLYRGATMPGEPASVVTRPPKLILRTVLLPVSAT